MADPTDFPSLFANMATVGQLTGHEEDAATQIASLQSRVDAVASVVAAASDVPLVFYEIDASDPSAPWSIGSGTLIDYLITQAGGQNLAGPAVSGDYVQISLDDLAGQDPFMILLADSNYGVTPESVSQRPGWETLSAVQNNRVYAFDETLTSQPGPRMVDALEQIAHWLHPDQFN